MSRLRGFTRIGQVVVNTEIDAYETIKRERARKRSDDSMRGEIDQLRGMILTMRRELEEMKRG